jgi:hypothetical protein
VKQRKDLPVRYGSIKKSSKPKRRTMSSRSYESSTISREQVVDALRWKLNQLGHREDIVDIQFGDLSLNDIPIKILTEEQEVKQFKLNEDKDVLVG